MTDVSKKLLENRPSKNTNRSSHTSHNFHLKISIQKQTDVRFFKYTSQPCRDYTHDFFNKINFLLYHTISILSNGKKWVVSLDRGAGFFTNNFFKNDLGYWSDFEKKLLENRLFIFFIKKLYTSQSLRDTILRDKIFSKLVS